MNFMNHISFRNPKKNVNLVMQTESAECALACLVMIINYYGDETDLASMRRRFDSSLKGMTLNTVIDIAQSLKLEARPLKAELEYLNSAEIPCILHWNMNHFVVLGGISKKGVLIYDPSTGKKLLKWAEVDEMFTGILLELKPADNFLINKKSRSISISSLTGHIRGIFSSSIQIIGLALCIEIITLLIPFQLQWTVDHVLPTSDEYALVIIAVGFLVAIIIQSGLSIARAWIISWLGASASAQWITNLFSHLLKLPLEYFEKRHMGDIVSRFSSVYIIQTTMTGGFIEAILDGFMGLLALFIIVFYSVKLTSLIIIFFSVYILLRWISYRYLWSINEEKLIYDARQQTELMESIRGVQAIKLANKISLRRNRLSNATYRAAKRSMSSQRIQQSFISLNHGLFGIQRTLLVAFGSYLVINGRFSTGMMIAFITYADQFANKIGNLIDKLVDFRMLKLHGERISDIALSSPDPNLHGNYSGELPAAEISLKNISFRYSKNEPWVLHNLNLSVRPGESVAIVGPSGRGKSTLAKVMLGLLQPTEGKVCIGGIHINEFGLDNYYKTVAAVMQDDTLFAGTIGENISFFDNSADIKRIIASAKIANIHEEISLMPMAYESLIGDMGSSLSGGQKQRILLARAVFTKPRILILDEATSHLDVKNEMCINACVKSMDITRIVFAHRTETIASADRVIEL